MTIILKMDKQRRIRIPKKVKVESDRVILVTLGPYNILIPIPKEKIEVDISESIQELKKIAEERAIADAKGRHKDTENGG